MSLYFIHVCEESDQGACVGKAEIHHRLLTSGKSRKVPVVLRCTDWRFRGCGVHYCGGTSAFHNAPLRLESINCQIDIASRQYEQSFS